jgi:DNA-binding beta-propeller fold protein YncE
MYDYWVVIDKTTGRIIAHCGTENDALMLVGFDKDKRIYHKQKFIMDQVITVTSTTDKQLPGQQGLPAAKEELPPMDLQQQVWLPEGQGIPVNAK